MSVRPRLVLCLCASLLALTAPLPAADVQPTPEQLKFFEAKVRPLLAERCFKCHGPEKQKGDLRIDAHASMLHGGESGPAVVPGNPEESLLIEAINYESFEMPPDGRLQDDEIEVLTAWVKMGAPWPQTDDQVAASREHKPKITDEDRAFWSFQPVRDPEVPQVPNDGWVRNDIDRFILQKLQQEGLGPAPEADRETLIRRASFDLHGLPPEPEAVKAFVADPSPGAYEALIDRLLESPRYGERWARYWLDLVRYADSDGYKQDDYRPQAWRYRDYVIRSLNEDKPYDRFVHEQLAGDEIAPDDPNAIVATGYLRHGIYEYNQRDVRTQWQTILNDVTDVTADVFLGMGMGCARCHDHKFDPILQKDYFRLQAFFTPLRPRDDLAAADAGQLAEYQRKQAEWEAATAEIRRQLAEIEEPLRERVGRGAIDKFPENIQPILRKTPEERTPLEQQLYELAWRQVLFEYDRLEYEKKLKDDQKETWTALKKQLAGFDHLKPEPLPTAFAATDIGPSSSPTVIPGDRKEEPIEPGFLTILDPEPARIDSVPTAGESTGRRTALARWLTSPENPLTARVMTNRVWQYHFGRGLVVTSSDFGRLGEPPTHPELLDWLTTRFVENGWKLKSLHRLIMTSAAYRQSAQNPAGETARTKDPENRWLWKAPTRRLEADQIRDAILAATGELDLTMGGPGVNAVQPRRTIYTNVFRNTRDPLLDVFDAPDAITSTAQRNVTTTPTQSLLMINGPWTLKRAETLSRRLQASRHADDAEVVANAFERVLGRAPQPLELQSSLEFLRSQAEKSAEPAPGEAPLIANLPGREGQAAVVQPGTPQARLVVQSDEGLPSGDFTIEAVVLLNSLYENASVRVIASQWDGDKTHPGWSFGVTSTQSSYEPRNLILELAGSTADGQFKYEVIPSNLRPELHKPYYVAVSVRVADPSPAGITFYLRDLSQDDAPLEQASAAHHVMRDYRPSVPFVLGGRADVQLHGWDGLLDDVRLSNASLPAGELLANGSEVHPETVGFWRFEEESGFNADASGQGRDVSRGGAALPPDARTAALVDLCHVLLNSNEFLYVK